jgi:hypothetical protein
MKFHTYFATIFIIHQRRGTVLELAEFNFFKFQQDSVYWRLKHGFNT